MPTQLEKDMNWDINWEQFLSGFYNTQIYFRSQYDKYFRNSEIIQSPHFTYTATLDGRSKYSERWERKELLTKEGKKQEVEMRFE